MLHHICKDFFRVSYLFVKALHPCYYMCYNPNCQSACGIHATQQLGNFQTLTNVDSTKRDSEWTKCDSFHTNESNHRRYLPNYKLPNYKLPIWCRGLTLIDSTWWQVSNAFWPFCRVIFKQLKSASASTKSFLANDSCWNDNPSVGFCMQTTNFANQIDISDISEAAFHHLRVEHHGQIFPFEKTDAIFETMLHWHALGHRTLPNIFQNFKMDWNKSHSHWTWMTGEGLGKGVFWSTIRGRVAFM